MRSVDMLLSYAVQMAFAGKMPTRRFLRFTNSKPWNMRAMAFPRYRCRRHAGAPALG